MYMQNCVCVHFLCTAIDTYINIQYYVFSMLHIHVVHTKVQVTTYMLFTLLRAEGPEDCVYNVATEPRYVTDL